MISIIIINFNGKQFINKLIESIRNQTMIPNEIIVIDNNSNDKGYLRYFSKLKNIKYIFLKNNTGFSYAVNLGIKISINNNIILLNNDIYLENDFVEKAVQYLRKFKNTFFAPLVMNYNGNSIDSAGDTLNWNMRPTKRFNGKKNIEIKNNIEEVDGFSMSACFFKKADFINNGKLNPNYFLYFEDVDFSIRAKNNGYNILFIPSIKAYHYVSAGTKIKYNSIYSPLKVFYESRNRFLFIFNNFRNEKIILRFFPYILGTIQSIIFHTLKTHYIFYCISGIFDALNHLRKYNYYD